MGCNESKAVDTELVIRCRERKELIKAAANYRYALAAAHISYFHSLKDVGEALRKFVDEELIVGNSSSSLSTPSSPSLILPDERKISTSNRSNVSGGTTHHKRKSSGSSLSVSTSSSISNFHDEDDPVHDHDHDHSHLHLSSDESEDDEGHLHLPHKGHRNNVHEVNVPRRGHRNNVHENYEPRRGHTNNLHQEFEGRRRVEGGEPSTSTYPQPYGMMSNEVPPYGVMNNEVPSYGMNMMNNEVPPYGMMNNEVPSYGMNMMNNEAPQPQGFWDPFYGMNPQFQAAPAGQQFGGNGNPNMYAYYMKKSSPVMKRVVHEADPTHTGYSNSYWSYPNENGGYFGYPPMGPPIGERGNRSNQGKKPSPPKEPPPPPSPKASAWDYFNPFEAIDSGYSGYFKQNSSASVSSSPNSTEVREREGIPDLEEETETEMYKEYHKGKKLSNEPKANSSKSSDSGRKSMPSVPHGIDLRSVAGHSSMGSSKPDSSLHTLEGSSTSRGVKSEDSTKPISTMYDSGSHLSSVEPSHSSGGAGSIDITEEKSNYETLVSGSPEDVHPKKKGVTFEVDEMSKNEIESPSRSSSLTTTSHAHGGTRDLHEVVAEIRDEFEIASSYGREVALMLEVGKLPYQPSFVKELVSRILYLIVPSMSVSRTVTAQSMRLAAKTRKLAKSYFEDVGLDNAVKPCHLSSTLDELYEWEKKLYKEVKVVGDNY